MDAERLAAVLERQDGVVSRRQVLVCGGDAHDVRRLVRRRAWARLLPGVYVDHTGPPTWRQRAWAAVLWAGPRAALDGSSALRADAGPGWRGSPDDAPIRVAIDVRRTVRDAPGVVVRRVAGLEDKVRWTASPPRLRVEEAALDLAMVARDDHAAFEELARAVRGRSTTAQRLLDTLAERPRAARREWVVGALLDLHDGSCSVLEQGYLRGVERAHGLPRARRQPVEPRAGGRVAHRDVTYEELGVVVELDGAAHAEPAQRDDDLERDLEVALSRRTTLRLGWGQVFRRPCLTAARVGRVLQDHGWTGVVSRCGPDCPVHDIWAA